MKKLSLEVFEKLDKFVDTKYIYTIGVGFGVVGGFGICYALYKIVTKRIRRELAVISEDQLNQIALEDTDLPLHLEHDYGSFRTTCLEADAEACAYLKSIPEQFFQFNDSFLSFTADIATKQFKKCKRALVVGSGTGFFVFELSKLFEEVRGIENSFCRVVTCFQFQNDVEVKYGFPLEGSYRTSKKPVSTPTLEQPPKSRGRVIEKIKFENCDPCQIPSLGRFQLVLIPNSLNTLQDPQLFLENVYHYVAEGGILIISSDYNWHRTTNRPLGFGTEKITNSFEFLESLLKSHFDFVQESEMMDVVGESLRKKMEGPALKRPKLLSSLNDDDWGRWYTNLDTLQANLLSGCLCHMDTIELQRPVFPFTSDTQDFPKDYTLQFISSINLLSDVALSQQAKGFMCPKLMEMASAVSTDEGIWAMLLEFLDSIDKFVTVATAKCFVSLLMWTKLPNIHEIFDELFTCVMGTSGNPMKLSLILEIIRGVIEYKEEDELAMEEEDNGQMDSEVSASNAENPLSRTNVHAMMTLPSPSSSPMSSCFKIELESECESEVKTLCIKALENWWTRVLSKFKAMMLNYREDDEAPIVTFLSLWLSIISVKANLSVVDTKHFYLDLESFVPLLSPSLPSGLWRKLLDVFNEILCYGSTLSLQDVPNDEPCNLAHIIIRSVKNRQLLQGVPFSRTFCGFGGSAYGPVDWEWESQPHRRVCSPNSMKSNSETDPSSPGSRPSSSKSFIRSLSGLSPGQMLSLPSPRSYQHQMSWESRTTALTAHTSPEPGCFPRHQSSYNDKVTATIYIGPRRDAVQLTEPFEDSSGDRPLLQKVVLLVLKSIAVTVKETRCDSDSSDSASSGSDSDTNDMIIIERSIREVFKQVDAFVKSLQPFHPAAPLGEWIVKLFTDQDDALVEAMLCSLDTFTGFLGRVQVSDFHKTLNPVKTFIAFTNAVSADRDTFLDLLMGNETSFLLYLLRFLKFAFKNWQEFISSCGRELEPTMGLLIRVRIALGRLVEKSLFPYNINPVLRLLEKCEELFESNGGSSS